MENESNLQINLLDESYTFYNNSIENFDKDFPSNNKNTEETTIFYENGNPINNDFKENTIVNTKFKQFKKQYAKYNYELAKQIYINKVRSINCYFIDEEKIDDIIHVLNSSSINLRDDRIIEKTISFNLKKNQNLNNNVSYFKIIFEINNKKNKIKVIKTQSENLNKINKINTINFGEFTEEKLKKIRYFPDQITKNLNKINELLKNNIKKNNSFYSKILIKNLIYKTNNKQLIKNLVEKDFNNDFKKIKINDKTNINNKIFGEIIQYNEDEYIFNLLPMCIDYESKFTFIQYYKIIYFELYLKLYNYFKDDESKKITNNFESNTFKSYILNYISPELIITEENQILYLDNKNLAYLDNHKLIFFNNELNLSKLNIETINTLNNYSLIKIDKNELNKLLQEDKTLFSEIIINNRTILSFLKKEKNQNINDNIYAEFLSLLLNSYLNDITDLKNLNFVVKKNIQSKNFKCFLKKDKKSIIEFNIIITNQNNNYIIQKTKQIKLINSYSENIFNNLSIIENSNKYIKKKNNVFKIKDNLMIITFNEESKKYNSNDLKILISYIINKKPLIIVVNTQESASVIGNGRIQEASHFQHILQTELFENNYKRLEKEDASIWKGYIGTPFLKPNKNVRLRIFYRNNVDIIDEPSIIKYSNNIDNKEINNIGKSKGLYFTNYFTKKRKIEILKSLNKISNLKIIKKKKHTMKKSTKFGNISESTIWKGSICFPLYLQKNNKIKKFIFVNSHLYFESKKYGTKSDTGLERRKKMFIDLINEFDLVKKYNNGYNIFFIGDLNFRLTKINDSEKNYLFQLNPKNDKDFIKKYITDIVKKYKEGSNQELYSKDEIYTFLIKEINKNNNTKILLQKFKESIEESKTFLSFKYKIDLKNENQNKFNNIESKNLKYNNIKKIFKTEDYPTVTKLVKKVKNNNNDLATIIKPPSNPDRILYALHNVNIKKNDLKMFMIPNKSDHKLITLNFDLNFN